MLIDPTKKNGGMKTEPFNWDNPVHLVGALEQAANSAVEMANDKERGDDIRKILEMQIIQLRTQAALIRQMVKQADLQRRAATGVVGARMVPMGVKP